jgi:hypothetical protein
VPAPFARFHPGNPPFSYLRREHLTEPMPPVSHSLMTDIDAAFRPQIFHVA